MTKKPENVVKLLEKVEPRARLPKPLKDASLLEQGMLVTLVRHLPQGEAERVLVAMRSAYPDWNELRVSQAQEIASLLATGERRAQPSDAERLMPVARAAREYLQEVFQKNHGFDLEFLREDPAAGIKAFTPMPFLGLGGLCYLLWLAGGKQVPSHPALVRVLERLGAVSKGAGGKRGKDLITPLIPPGKELEFVAALGEVADRWCHAQKPVCHDCPLVEDCAFGKKAYQEWKVQQARLEAQRVKEEARRRVLEKKEAERRAREDARLAKKAAADAAKAARERERLAKVEARRKEAEAKVKAKADAAAKKVAAEAARKAAAAAKKAAEAQKRADLQAKAAKEREKKAKAAEAAKKKADAKKKAAKPKAKGKAGGKRKKKTR